MTKGAVNPCKPANWLHQALLGYKEEGVPAPRSWIWDLYVTAFTDTV